MKAFMLMGQSNMSGRGVMGELPTIVNEHVFRLNGGVWEQAVEPIVRDRPFSGEGLSLTFGDIINKVTGEDIGLIPCSLGGTSLDQWAVGGELYTAAVNSAKAALMTGAEISAILWHQGETDSDTAEHADTYLKRLNIIMTGFMRDIRAAAAKLGRPELIPETLPVIVGELGNYLFARDDCAYYAAVNAQLQRFAAQRPEYVCVTAHDLGHKGDGLHFGAKSLRRLGLRYANAYLDLIADIAPESQTTSQPQAIPML